MTPKLTALQIFKLLRRHRKLAERRDPIYESNKMAKWIIGISMSFTLVYLMGFAVMLALGANESRDVTTLEFIMAFAPMFLIVDFCFRFIAQQTPSQIIKPYVLLPLPRYACIDCFMVDSLFNWGNAVWFALLIPYCIMSVVFSHGVLATLSVLLLYYLLILCNSQLYSISRTLINHNVMWWALPIAVWGAIASPIFIIDFNTAMETYAMMGSGLESGNILPHLAALLVLVGLVAINRRLQYKSVMMELSRQADSTPKKVFNFGVLDDFGEMGEYLKLEVKLLMRNKNPRKGFIMAAGIVLLVIVFVTFTDIYDNEVMTNVWGIYAFLLFATMLLMNVMSYEGNYIDVLMVHKENILKLLKSKYYFYNLLLLFPLVITLPAIIMGKWSLLMILSYGIFTAGFEFFLLMQLAVYNNKSMPLNEKFINKGGVTSNYIQMGLRILTLVTPFVVIGILQAFLPIKTAWLTMMGIGLVFIATHNLWLRNVYNRMMTKRYKTLESFHA